VRFDAGRKAAARRPLLFLPMKTVLYIDGFNLYYGCLRHSPYKWLNPAIMAAHLLCPWSLENRSAVVTSKPATLRMDL